MRKPHKSEVRIRKKKSIPMGTWVPASIAGFLTGYASETIRELGKKKKIRSFRFHKCPVLYKVEDLIAYIEKSYVYNTKIMEEIPEYEDEENDDE